MTTSCSLTFRNIVTLIVVSGGLFFSSKSFAVEPPLSEVMVRLPPVEVDQVQETFQLEHGFKLELVAGEPLVGDPVDACFDEFGRMFVAEFHAYPYALEKEQIIPAGKGRTTTGIVRMLEDTNDDGIFDKSTIFADKLDWPLSVVPYDGGIFLIDVPDVLYLKDTDGDGIADIRKLVYTHLGRDNVQGVANNMKWGLDNRIWVASGSNGGEIVRDGTTQLKLGRSDWVFDPRTLQVGRASGAVQFGHSMDDWGNRFLCSNSDHMVHVTFESRYLDLNPYYQVPRITRSVAKEGGAAPVYRRSPVEPWRIVRTARRVADPKFAGLPASEKVPGGFFTSASGITIYRGDAYPEEFRGNAFVGDVGSNLIHRKTVAPNNASFLATRADQNTEFVTSTDTWFRPVNFVNAPDGSLFVLDMYRETIEHPISIPPDIKAHLDLESGNDRGRIYRLVSPGMKRQIPDKLGNFTTSELVDSLASTNSWTRETAQRLLVQQQNPQTAGLLRDFLKTTTSPLGKLHALYILKDLRPLDPHILETEFGSTHSGLREHAIRLAEPILAENRELAATVLGLLNDAEFRPRFHAVLALGFMNKEQALQGLELMAPRIGEDPDLQSAFMLAVGDRGADLFNSLLKNPTFLETSAAKSILAEIAKLVGARPEKEDVVPLLISITREDIPAPLQDASLLDLELGLTQRGSSIAKTIADLPSESPEKKLLTAVLEASAITASNEKTLTPTRIHAAQRLSLAPWELSAATLETLLLSHQPVELQETAISTIGKSPHPEAALLLIQSLKGVTPALKGKILDALLAQGESTRKLLEAIEREEIRKSEVDRTKLALLLQHPQEDIRKRATTLFVDSSSSSRKEIVEQSLSALEITGDVTRGQLVYVQKCSMCHRLNEQGHQVGPDMVSVQNKSPEDLLIAILDPNRELQLSYINYSVSTQDGHLFTGLIASESPVSLTLRKAEGIEATIQRDQIDQLVSSGLSLMPEGFEKELTPQQIADLITFIKSLAPAAPEQSSAPMGQSN
ncbi:PVC-type heme-binding CxxCH protein [Planctomicrobium sp. SH668]|uniref:PVC-type heme-binding CxxCH protein n=1 Tax=Planctomicrobium sp. SH668 TaxID=3448126 RepID=UPI003F5AFE1C